MMSKCRARAHMRCPHCKGRMHMSSGNAATCHGVCRPATGVWAMSPCHQLQAWHSSRVLVPPPAPQVLRGGSTLRRARFGCSKESRAPANADQASKGLTAMSTSMHFTCTCVTDNSLSHMHKFEPQYTTHVHVVCRRLCFERGHAASLCRACRRLACHASRRHGPWSLARAPPASAAGEPASLLPAVPSTLISDIGIPPPCRSKT